MNGRREGTALQAAEKVCILCNLGGFYDFELMNSGDFLLSELLRGGLRTLLRVLPNKLATWSCARRQRTAGISFAIRTRL